MIIRPESTGDYDAIRRILIAAFADHPYSHQTEHLIVEALRAAGALSVALVAEIDGKVVSYCPDTGYCENAVILSRGADLLIAECAYKTGQGSEEWPHLNPETAARIACEAKVKRLALVHFDARLYPTMEDRRESEAVARSIFPNAFAAYDDMEVDV